MSATPSQYEDRRSSRRWIINETVEIVVGDKAYDFEVTDVSGGGARIVADVELEAGMKVVLQLPGPLHLPAKVVHKQAGGAGIQFEIGVADRGKLFDWIAESSRRREAAASAEI